LSLVSPSVIRFCKSMMAISRSLTSSKACKATARVRWFCYLGNHDGLCTARPCPSNQLVTSMRAGRSIMQASC
jgi:hypothetical protein